MLNRSRWKRLKQMSPSAQWWEIRHIASGYRYSDGSPADREVLRLIKWAIRRHKEQDRREALETTRGNAA